MSVRHRCRRASASTPAPAPSPARRQPTGSPFSFTITATDSVGITASQAYTVAITGSSTPITIVSRTVNGDLLNVTSSISSAVETAGSTTVQITTSSADGFYVGELVQITSVGTAAFNGTYTVASVIDATDFTYTDANFNASSPGSISNGGSAVNALGGAQRSMVDSITYEFNQAVTLGTGAITMDVNSGYTGTAGVVAGTISYATIDDGHTWIVTFSGTNVTGNSIADGVYDITLNASAVTADVGSGTLASSQTDTFFRLFGDSNGDASVTSRPDVQNFAAAFGSSNTSSGLPCVLRLQRGRLDHQPPRCPELRHPLRNVLDRLHADHLGRCSRHLPQCRLRGPVRNVERFADIDSILADWVPCWRVVKIFSRSVTAGYNGT